MVQVVEVRITHPAWKAGEVQVEIALHRVDADTLLPGISPLFAHHNRLHRCWGHHQHHKFYMVKRLDDLQPPVASTFHADTILPQRDTLNLQTHAQCSGKILPIATRIGNEDSRFFEASSPER